MAINRTIDAVARAVEAGAAVSTGPGDRMEIQVAGLTVDPKAIEAAVEEPDVTLLTDVVMTALEGPIGASGAGLGGLDRIDGLMAVDPDLDGYTAPAEGQWVTPGAIAEDSNHLSTFNATGIEDLGLAIGAGGGQESPSDHVHTISDGLGDKAGRPIPDQDEDAPPLALVDLVVGQGDGPNAVADDGGNILTIDASPDGISGSSGDTVIVTAADGNVAQDSGDALAVLVQGVAAGAFDASDFLIA